MKNMGIHTDGNYDSQTGILMTLGTFFLYIVGLLSVSEWASVAAIFAGLMAGGFNGYKLWMIIKSRKKPKN